MTEVGWFGVVFAVAVVGLGAWIGSRRRLRAARIRLAALEQEQARALARMKYWQRRDARSRLG